MSYVFSLVLSNFLALICFLLVVFNSIHTKRDSMLWISLGMMLLTLMAYIVIGCYDAAAATVFAALRNFICLKYPNLKKGIAVKASALLFGTAFSAWCAYRVGGTWVDYLPALSFLFCSGGYYLTKSPSALRIVNAVDILLFWIVFDYHNLMIFNVVTDLFVVLFPLAEQYVKQDQTDYTKQSGL